MSDHKKQWEVYYQLMLANGTSSLYKIARDLHLFDVKAGESFTLDEIAKKYSYEKAPLEILFQTMTAMGVFQKNKEAHYSLAPDMIHLQGSYQNLGDEYWEHLASLVKTGVPYKKSTEQADQLKDYQAQVTSLGWMMESAATEMTALLKLKEAGEIQLLDIGAGSGVWSVQTMLANKKAHASLYDWPFLLPIAQKNCTDHALLERTQFTGGNILEMPFPKEKFHYAFMGNLTHLHSPANNKILFQKAFDALLPGGALVIQDTFGEDPRGAAARAFYQMGLTIKTAFGKVYSSEEMKPWLMEAGFTSFELISFDVAPYTMGMYIARKKK